MVRCLGNLSTLNKEGDYLMADIRLLTAMITPYDEQLEVNYVKAVEVAEMLVAKGSEGIVVCGTTGEAPVLSAEEKIKLFSAVKQAVGNRVQVWAGTGSNYTKGALELSQKAEKIGVDGVMVVTPYYNKPSPDGLYQHFKTIAEGISIPVMLYNVPGRTSVNLTPDTVKRLSAIENIVALKEASGDMDQLSLLMNLVPDDFTIYSGDDSNTLPMMALGAAGVVSISSHLVGNQIKAMIEHFVNGEVEQARNIHAYLFPLFKGLFVTTNPVPLKEALNIKGMNVGGLRLPLTPVTPEQRSFIKELLENY